MKIALPKKFALPSNKTVKGIKNEDENVKEKVELRLDRLSITLQVKDKETQKGILGAFYTAAGNTSEYVNLSSSGKRYKVNISAYLGPNHSHVLYQAAPKNKKDAFVRIEFNPAKLGPAGIADMKADLATLLPSGWDTLLNFGRITRYDIAVDLPGVPINQVHAMSAKLMKTTVWGNGGNVETIKFGSKKSVRQIVIYDKAKELKIKGVLPLYDPLTRVEVRVVRNCISITELAEMSSPLNCVELVILPPAPLGAKAYDWDNFLCRLERDGANVALGALPPAKRAKYRKQLKLHPAKFWKPDELWASWSDEINKLGLLTPTFGEA